MTHGEASPSAGGAESAAGLLGRLRREADAAIAACEAAAQSDARRVREEAARAAEAQRHEALATRAGRHELAQRAARDMAQQRVVAETLQARAEAIDRVLTAAAAQAERLASHPGLPDLLSADITSALRYLPDDAVTVRCPASLALQAQDAVTAIDAARTGDGVGDHLGERVRVAVDPAVPFGLIAQSGDGRVTVDATIARRIASDRPRLAIRIAQLLAESFA